MSAAELPGSDAQGLDRRSLLRAFGAGSALLIGARFGVAAAQPTLTAATAATIADPLQPSLWLAIAPDGAVKIWAHRSEMGTGIRTSLPMVVADELGCDWERVTIEQAFGDAAYGDQNTDGSWSIRGFYETMRKAGAAARWLLEQAAAKQWGCDAAKCTAREHAVHGPGGERLGFGELVEAARALALPTDEQLRFRKPEELRYVGKDKVRFYDAADITVGKAKFGADVRPEGMVFAAIWRVPVLGGTIESVDDTAARKVPGVIDVVRLPAFQGAPAFQALGGVAVIARNTWAAFRGRDALQVKWSGGDAAKFSTDEFYAAMRETAQKPGKLVREVGDAAKALEAATERHEATYTVPFLAHAQMEPMVATADVTDAHCRVWTPTQNPQGVQQMVAMATGRKPEQVEVHVTLLGGGFGRKSKPDYCVEAALLSKQLKKPVRVQWSREDDTRFDYYHSAAAVRIEAGLGDDGKVVAWHGRSVFPPIGTTFDPRDEAAMPSAGELGLGFTELPYPIPALRLEAGSARAPTRIGWMRSVHHVQHAFAECSFVDELASIVEKDRVEFLEALIGAPRHVDMSGTDFPNQGASMDEYPVDTGRLLGVLREVATKGDWKGRNKLPRGRGLGIAAHRSFLGYVAVIVEVDVARDGTVRIPRVDVAIDAGTIVNPDRVRAQLEGAATFGTAIAMLGEITFENGAVVQSNYHDYAVPRLPQAPREVRTYLVSSDAPPSGVGETGTPPIAPAICNAIYAAVGKRVRDLPVKKHDLSWS
ncbi:MAG: molybdopterin cofactor-binding domain-containing protein [Planctomycetota bacterium]